MSSKLHFLGTGCMLPTKDRNPLAVAFEFNGEIFLFDCAEGTQRQIKTMKLPIGKIKRIFITHWHGDHTLGLAGLIQTLSNTDNVSKIEIHGPKDTKKFVEHTFKSSVWESKVEIKIFEYNPKENEVINIIDNANYEINCAKMMHSTPCIGYNFKQKDVLNIDMKKLREVEPKLEQNPILSRVKMGLDIEFEGKKIKSSDITYNKEGLKVAFIFDTRPCQGVNLLARDADYLVIEATHMQKHQHKSEETDHMASHESAQIAVENGVGELIITHFSQRYKDVKEIEEEAKEIFENTISTQDLMTIKLSKKQI